MSSEAIEIGNEGRLRRSSSVDYIAARWCTLPPHVRETIITLVDASLLASQHQHTSAVSEEDNP